MTHRIWINAGEFSGDMHGAALLRALREENPDVHAMGMGGEELEKAGQKNFLRVEQLSVMGGLEVLTALPRAWSMLRQIQREMLLHRPKAVILIDAPDFNFRVAAIAQKLGIPIYYYIPPKAWAWREQRVNFLRKNVRAILSILPFEEQFYNRHGMDIHYVGNPLLDDVNLPAIQHIQPEPLRIGVMPGSRKSEVEHLLPLFAHVADRLVVDFPKVSFHCLRAPNMEANSLLKLWDSILPLHIEEPQGRYATMRTCQFLLSASGTATLESGLAQVPTLVCYKLNPITYALGRPFIKAPWASLTNLILNQEVFPEFMQEKAEVEPLVAQAAQWLTQPDQLEATRHSLEPLQQLCLPHGATKNAARFLLDDWALI